MRVRRILSPLLGQLMALAGSCRWSGAGDSLLGIRYSAPWAGLVMVSEGALMRNLRRVESMSQPDT